MTKEPVDAEGDWVHAIEQLDATGDTDPLEHLLWSKRGLLPLDRHYIADVFKRYKLKQKNVARPPPPKLHPMEAIRTPSAATMIYTVSPGDIFTPKTTAEAVERVIRADPPPDVLAWMKAILLQIRDGNPRALIELMDSDQPLSYLERIYIAFMLSEFELIKKRSRPPTPAYKTSDIEARIAKAMAEVRADPSPRRETIPKYARLNRLTPDTLQQALDGRRGGTRRSQKRTRPKVGST